MPSIKQAELIEQILPTVKQLVVDAGKNSLQAFLNHDFSKREKSDHTIVTEVDVANEKLMRSLVEKKFPEHQLYGEEFGGEIKSEEVTWVFDPIDGTTNFVSLVPIFSSMVSVLYQNQVIAAAIYFPVTNQLIWAGKNLGAFSNEQRIQAVDAKSLGECVLQVDVGSKKEGTAFAVSYLKENVDQYRSFRRYGGMAQPLSLAAGIPFVCFFTRANVYDLAPIALINHEGGYKTFNLEHQSWRPELISDLVICPPSLETAVFASIKNV